MKVRLLMTFFAVMLLGAGVMAQDNGDPDTLVVDFRFVPPNADSIAAGHDSVVVSVYTVNDVGLGSMSSSVVWNTDMLVLDSGVVSPAFGATFIQSFVYFRDNIDSSNAYQAFQCTGISFGASWGGTSGVRNLCGDWYFTIAGMTDSIRFDIGNDPQLKFVEGFSNEFVPQFGGPARIVYNGTSVNSIGNGSLPNKFGLAQNYPNPFNPDTRIQFDIPTRTHVTLTVFNVLGQRVATLVDEELAPDSYEKTWNGIGDSGAKVASGIYFYRLTADDKVETKKMMLLK